MKLHIGFDDTDSLRMGCTTYIAALIIEKFRKLEVSFIDYPNLIRLNPNVPWKTRGNGALCLRILCADSLSDEVKEIAIETVEKNADLGYEGTDPGIVLLAREVPNKIEAFARRTITGIVRKDEAMTLIRRFGAEAVGYKKGRGIVGGLAAIGERLKGDHTYEYIAYRTPENRGTPRKVDAPSVIQMEKQMGRLTFNNVDAETGRVLITPRGPDPILYGIRGESAEAVRRAQEFVVSGEPVERWVIFRTNQGTDAHLKQAITISQIKPHNPVVVQSKVVAKPRIIQGGHVIFQIEDETGRVDCAAYEPTGILRYIADELMAGDVIEACGGIRTASSKNPVTINLEKIQILKLAPNINTQNPACPACGKRMKSMGKNQGFECRRCGYHGPNLKKITTEAERSIKPGLFITTPRSQRHLTKPLTRYGLEKLESSRTFEKVIPYNLFSGH